MNYSCRYKENPTFPYKNSKEKRCVHTKIQKETVDKKEKTFDTESSLFNSIFSPIENILGRKIAFDDILLVAIIYVLFTEKDNENNTLLLCLLFILLS